MRRFVIGDIHGAYKALTQCLERACFDLSQDMLICMGDVCDGFPDVPACLDKLLEIKHLEYILGNHDVWFLQWAMTGQKPEVWLHQGGKRTIESYNGKPSDSHISFLENARKYLLKDNILFVHGGMIPGLALEEHEDHVFMWDRTLVMDAIKNKEQGKNLTGYKNVYVGHTPTLNFNSHVPLKFCELILMDTGAGWGHKLSMMDIDTGEVFQSEPTSSLYKIKNIR